MRANDPLLQSWVAIPPESDFPIQNLPFGIFQPGSARPRVGVAIGDYVVDCQFLAENGFFADLDLDLRVFGQGFLNDFIEQGREKTRAVRDRLSVLLDRQDTRWNAEQHAAQFLLLRESVSMLLPVRIGDYTDFYSSIEHATNVGAMMRDPNNALLPNWRHLPVAYHGRASSIVVSGTPIHRPKGQILPEGSDQPILSDTKMLDFELEMGYIVGKNSNLGQTIPVNAAEDYIFGLVLFNDWSARDIQRWEYIPLGPFLGKNFGSTISPWVVTLDAMEPFRVESPIQEPSVLPYLAYSGQKSFDIQLSVTVQTKDLAQKTVCQSNFRYMYWNIAQQIAHHTINGCNLRIGDLCASGTLSGPYQESFGSLLEITWRGTKPIQFADGTERKFLEDGDTVILKGYAANGQVRIGFGEASGTISAIHEYNIDN